VAARPYTRAGLLALAVPTCATFYIANETTNRYTNSGWGDGLEIFNYVGSTWEALCTSLPSWRRAVTAPWPIAGADDAKRLPRHTSPSLHRTTACVLLQRRTARPSLMRPVQPARPIEVPSE
jgi:hypothetical protein